MEQLTLFENFDKIENYHEDNTIYFEAIKWRAKFKETGNDSFKRRVDIYCSSRQQLKQLKLDLLDNDWREIKRAFASPAISFSKADMLVVFHGVYG